MMTVRLIAIALWCTGAVLICASLGLILAATRLL
jgi:hypothetical protein